MTQGEQAREGGWAPFPGAKTPPILPPVAAGRVVGLGAICDLEPQRRTSDNSQGFSVSEFVMLEDGRRVMLHEERGFTIGWRSPGHVDSLTIAERETLEILTRDVLNVVLPDDDEPVDDHSWAWLAGLAQARGIRVTENDLRALAYEVTFTDDVRRWLAQG